MMSSVSSRVWILPLISAWVFCAVSPAEIVFDDSAPERIVLSNATHWELAFSKTEGRLFYVLDKTTGQQVSPGNVFGPWVARYENGFFLDGAVYSPGNPNRRFSYTWDAQLEELVFTYETAGSLAGTIEIVISPTEGPEINSVLTYTSNSALDIDLLAYPVQFAFVRSEIEGVYMPHSEGMKLLPSFFANWEYVERYPGRMFADFAHIELSTGQFAVYALQDLDEDIKPVDWKLLRDNGFAGGVHKIHHDYLVRITNGDTWVSPVTVLSVGASLPETMDDYWTRGGYAAMPTLREKLGDALHERLAGSVQLKADIRQRSTTFLGYLNFIQDLPPDNLLHLVSFWPVDFDEFYPDYLPPDPALGSLQNLQQLVSGAQADGHLVMPYTNPTWWDDESPTLAQLGTNIVARDAAGNLIMETYFGRDGFVVSPWDPQVIARQDQTRVEFTTTVPMDFLFEDQVGARNGPNFADHPSAPDPIAYTQGLVNVAERSASFLPIMSEGGYDRLSFHESGYCLSTQLAFYFWPQSTFTSYPMSPLWAHENLYFNAHNLADSSMSNDLPLLTFYVSRGYSLSHDLSRYDPDWLRVLDAFQKGFISKLVGRGMSAFSLDAVDGRSDTTFADGTVVTANLTGGQLLRDGHIVAPDGFVAQKDGVVLAGVLRQLNGAPLAGNDPHYLVFDYDRWKIDIQQPRGDSTNLIVLLPSTWTDLQRIFLTLTTVDGTLVPQVGTPGLGTLFFNYQTSFGGESVDRYTAVYCRFGDVNCDGQIAADDLAGLDGCLSGPDVTAPSGQGCAFGYDTNADTDVDLADLAAIQLDA